MDWSDEVKARLEEDICAAGNATGALAQVYAADIRAALGEIERLERPLDVEYTTSCGHKWTMRHTACPTCFGEIRDEVKRLRRSMDRFDLEQHRYAERLLAKLKTAEAEVERLREALASYDSLSLVIETAVREMRDRDSREACNYEALLRTIDRARAALRGGVE